MAFCAGFVDTAAYSELRRIYTSHMTGNTALFASHLVHRGWKDAGRWGWAIACFLVGLLGSAALTHIERRNGIRSAFAAALGLEVSLLLIFVLLGRFPYVPEALLIFLPAAAMGVQTVTVTRVGSLRVYTTYLTATLAKFAEALTNYFFWCWDRTKGRFRRRIGKVLLLTPRQESARQVALTAGLWMGFFAGAAAGFGGDNDWGRAALTIPMALLASIVVVDLRCPVALGEVRDDEIRRRRHRSWRTDRSQAPRPAAHPEVN